MVMFDLATVEFIEHSSSLDAEYTIHFGAFFGRLGGSVYGQRCESKASTVIGLCYLFCAQGKQCTQGRNPGPPVRAVPSPHYTHGIVPLLTDDITSRQ